MAADILNQINNTRSPELITQNGEPGAVLRDTESYENINNAPGILKLLSQSKADVKDGKVNPQESVFAAIERKIT
jgi:PHD/YefM family antitoxin component YafN of YafNO toxin-antitoxin module